jgi:RNA polymerase sigma-70 factor (ECF subfamily)
VNGQPGAVFLTGDGLVISVVSVDVVDGKVSEIRSIVNPDKLRHVGEVADLAALIRLRPDTAAP